MADGKGEDKADLGLYYTEELARALPDLPAAFQEADLGYRNDPLTHLSSLEHSTFAVKQKGAVAICSLRYSADSARSSAINITSHGFSDDSPQSSAEKLNKYTEIENPGFSEKEEAKPNTWSAITKAASMHDVRQLMGVPIPQVDIYRPTHLHYRGGDFSSFADTVEAAVTYSQDILHGKNSETQITELHLGGLSLGASEVMGAAAEIKRMSTKLDVKSVTAYEIIMGLHYPELIRFGGLTGEPSTLPQPTGNTIIIPEPLMRQRVDKYGNESTMVLRMLGAMGKMAVQLGNGLPKPRKTIENFEYLADNEVPITVALAKNSYASHRTTKLLPDSPQIKVITIDTLPGKKIGHIANEHVAGLVAISLLGIKRASAK